MTAIDTPPTAQAVGISPASDANEGQLIKKVGTLRQAHTRAQTTLTKSRGDMKVIRTDLARRLHELKAVLSRPAEPDEVTVRRYLHSIWPKMSRILTTPESVEMFIDELRRKAAKSFGMGALSGG